MSLVGNIENVCKEKALTFKALEREAGIGNGTIRRWEIQSPRLDVLLKVANYLHVSIDELIYGSGETATVCDGEPLSEDEADLVAMYRCLPMEDQEEIFAFTKFKYNRQERKRGSSFSAYTGNGKTKISDPEEGESTSGIA